jgi:stage II sporulation protein D
MIRMLGKFLALALLLLSLGPACAGKDVRIGVLGLFHPRQLIVTPARSEALVLAINGQRFVLEPGSPANAARITVTANAMRAEINGRTLQASAIQVTSRDGGMATLLLTMPGKVSRRYRGTLSLIARHGEIVPVVTMELDTAVASAVLAESAPGTPEEALKAQAIVSRSYYVAGAGRHKDFDFCDLTHCQFLREPPVAGSPAAGASAATKGLILSYEDRPVAAMFTRSCGGKTLTPAQAGMPSNGYPYFAVVCDYCLGNPVRWARRISPEDAALLLNKGEAGRLAVDRRLGWNAVPSNDFTARAASGQVLLQGKGQGHGIGLCQRGAAAMARNGATFREILTHYFPNTTIVQLPQ